MIDDEFEDGMQRIRLAQAPNFIQQVETGEHSDVIFVTKERMEIRAHKAVLARDEFWRSLLVSNKSDSPSETTIHVPDYTFREMHLLLTSYYRECLVFKTKEDRTAFARLQRSFSRETSFRDLCRICKRNVEINEFVAHIIEHVKKSCKTDKLKSTDYDYENIRCSFKDKTCQLEKHRETVINGIYNNVDIHGEYQMKERIKEHYRRHLRDEIQYISRYWSDFIQVPEDETLYVLADIKPSFSTSSSGKRPIDADEEEHPAKRPAMADDDDDESDYSGGLSSPDEEEGGDGRSSSPAVVPNARSRTSSGNSKLNTSGNDTDAGEQSSKNESTIVCRECGQRTKQMVGFKKHILSHLVKHTDDKTWKMSKNRDGHFQCQEKNCKKGDKTDWSRWAFQMHMAFFHKQLDAVLASRNETVADWEKRAPTSPGQEARLELERSKEEIKGKKGSGTGPIDSPAGSDSSSTSSSEDLLACPTLGNSNVPPAPTTGGMTNSGIKIQDLVQRPVSTATAATAVASSPQKEMEKEDETADVGAGCFDSNSSPPDNKEEEIRGNEDDTSEKDKGDVDKLKTINAEDYKDNEDSDSSTGEMETSNAEDNKDNNDSDSSTGEMETSKAEDKKDNEDSDSTTAEMETSNAEENLNDESDSPVADRETGNPEEDSGDDSDSTIAAENNDL